MMRSSSEIQHKRKMWNFVTASVALAHFHMPDTSENDKKRDFINKINNEIKNAFMAVKELMTFEKRYNDALSAIDIVEIAKRYQRAHYVTFEYALAILAMIDAEYTSYLAKHDSEQSSDYSKLLIHLRNCCLGIINNSFTHPNQSANDCDDDGMMIFYYEQIKKFCKAHSLLYDFAVATGGSFIPAFQILDPLIGTENSGHEKFADDAGHCYGHVYAWARRIVNNGNAACINLLDEFAYEMQNNQLQLNTDHITSAADIADEIVNTMHADGIYKISVSGDGFGHALGVRTVSGTNFIEFFDPNLGSFILEKNKFTDLFTLYLSDCVLNYNLNYTEINMHRIGKQKVTLAVDSVEKKIDGNVMAKYTSKLAFTELLTLTESKMNSGFFDGVELKVIKKAFIDEMSVRIKYTSDVGTLKQLQELFSKPADLFAMPENKKLYFIKRLHDKRHPVLDFMMFKSHEESGSITRLKEMIFDRLNELQPADALTYHQQLK